MRASRRLGRRTGCGLACASAVSAAVGAGNLQPTASPLLVVEGFPADQGCAGAISGAA